MERRLSVEDSNISIDQVALDLQTGLWIAVSVNGSKTVFDIGSLFCPLIKGTATVRAGHFEVFWERLSLWLVGLSQLMHPSVMKDSTRVILCEHLSVFINALQVQNGCIVIDGVGHFLEALVHAIERDLLLNDQTR